MTIRIDDLPGYAEQLRQTARCFPDRRALVLDDECLTYHELIKRASLRAQSLRSLELSKGDKIALLMPNCIEFVEIFIGASMLGIVVVPINTRFRAFELSHILKDSEVACILTTGAVDAHVNFKTLLTEALTGLDGSSSSEHLCIEGFPALRHIVHFGSNTPPCMLSGDIFHARAETVPELVEADAAGPRDLQLLMYTSGTTAAPKGCLLPNRCLVSTSQLTSDLFSIGPDDVWWCPLPMFHIGGLLFMTVCFAAGATFVGMGHFNLPQAFEQFEQEKPTVLYPLFPTIALPVIEDPRFAQTDFSRVRYVFNVGPEEIQTRLQNAFPDAKLLSAYGMSETTGIVTFNSPSDSLKDRTTSVGHFLPGWSARIVDPENRVQLASGKPGEIAVKGPALFAGYLNQPELTAASHTADGYFLTGDYGTLSEEGLVRFLGRLKDQMKVGGENVSALEVESFLAKHPNIRLAQVVPIPDARYGEVPAAFLELSPGMSLNEADVIAYCSGKIASFKVPRQVRFVSDWPMSATKVAKFKLQRQLIAELGLS